ncbi:DUF4153 domain-containing protein [uncultured Williamsia sp.]|uniref:DUF4153 domain-containing protein n=1 Tax=uncultured Williamsia sp. TaxID=259311 RepID=UPI00263470D9|nr:DUF4173 domain-containing protein [uncultured Williamsia sp.]
MTTVDDIPPAAPARVPVAVAGAGLVAAIAAPSGTTGIGVVIITVGILAAVVVGARRGRPTPLGVLGVLAVAALVSVAAWRSAEWVVDGCLVLAAVSAVGLVVDARTLRQAAFGGFAAVVLTPRAVAWSGRAVARLRGGRSLDNPGAVAAVAVVTVALAVVFGALFAGADAAFAHLLAMLTPDIGSLDLGPQIAVGVLVALVTTIGIHLRWARPRSPYVPSPPQTLHTTWMWALPAGTVLLVSIAFLVTQASTLFGGDDHVQRTVGLTYAEYARSGFWQLFVATALTIAVVAVAWRRSPQDTTADRAAVRVILGGLCLAALAVVASALHRMDLYVDAFGATRLRVGATAVELWFAVVLVALMAAGAGFGTRQFARAIAGVTIVGALAFAAYDPDARIAEINVDRYEKTGRVDVGQLSDLSPDAADQLLRLPPHLRDCVLTALAGDVRMDRRWADTNLARERARHALGDLRPVDPGACAG